MGRGRDHDETLRVMDHIPKTHKGFMHTILVDAVYTPHRAHKRWGKDSSCPFCQAPVADWEHFIDHCPRCQPPQGIVRPAPRCLRYTGSVPLGWNPAPKSKQTADLQDWGAPHGPPQLYEGTVATDGGCVDTFGGRAGWGLAYECHGARQMSGALPGPWQTAQRAEVYVVLAALSLFTGPLAIVTDSRYAHDRIECFFPQGS